MQRQLRKEFAAGKIAIKTALPSPAQTLQNTAIAMGDVLQ